MIKNNFYKKFDGVTAILYRYRHYLIAAYFILSVIFFFVQFDLLKKLGHACQDTRF